MSPGEVVLTFFIAFSSAVVWRQTSQLRTELKVEIGDLRTELKAEIGDLRTELKAEIREIRGELAIMRSDLTQVALAVGAGRASEI